MTGPQASATLAPPAAPSNRGAARRIRDPATLLDTLGTTPWALLAVFGLAVVVRVYAVLQARFDGDESSFWEAALDIAEGAKFHVIGHPMSGSPAGHPGALFYYLMSTVQFFTAHPLAGSLLVAALNVLALWLLFDAVRSAWSPRAAAIVLLSCVASPWVIVYADRIWPGNLSFLLCACVVWALVRMSRVPRSRAIALLALVLIAGMQIHFSTLQLWFAAALGWAIVRPRMNGRALVAGLLCGALCYVPYLVHEVGSGFANSRLLLAHVGEVPWSGRALAGLLLHFFALPTTDVSYLIGRGYWHPFDHFSFWAGDGASRTQRFYDETGIGTVGWVFQAASWALVLIGLGTAIASVARNRARLRGAALVWLYVGGLVSVPILYSFSQKGGYAHYVTMLAPLAFLPSVVALLAALRHKWLGHAAVLYLLAVPVVGFLILRGLYVSDSRLSIAQQRRIVEYVVRKTGGVRPFSLEFREPDTRCSACQRIARRQLHLPWREQRNAADRFIFRAPQSHRPSPSQDFVPLGGLEVKHIRSP
jgi:hypothetical protein